MKTLIWPIVLIGATDSKEAKKAFAYADTKNWGKIDEILASGEFEVEMQEDSKIGRKLLQIATAQNDLEAMKMLLRKYKADANAIGPNGQTAIYGAKSIEAVKLIKEFAGEIGKRCVFGATVLNSAIFNGNLELIKFLISQKMNLNTQDFRDGFTPLHIAVVQKLTPIIELLLKNNADTTIRDNKGHRAEDLANTEEIIELFKKNKKEIS